MEGDDIQSMMKIDAAGGILLLAAILITGCQPAPASLSESAGAVTATFSPTAVVISTSIPAVVPSPTDTPQPSTPTATVIKEALATDTIVPTDTPPATATTTPSPTIGPPSTQTPTPRILFSVAENSAGGSLIASETTITLLTYPIWDYLIEQVDPIYNIPVLYFHRPNFEAAAPPPSPVDYKAVVLENNYIRLTFLPELGGRLYSAVVKSTGQEIFYHNPVVKASRYGILQPYEANWWLATGGMEWAYPTQEHGYRWGVPWEYEIVERDDRLTITLSDVGADRVGVEVEVSLAIDSPLFSVSPSLTNRGAAAVPVQFWLNAALALAPNTMSLDTQFIVPTDQAVVHSRGAEGWTVPDAHSEVAWPQVDDVNLGNYRQWQNYLGLFIPNSELTFMGAYNPDTNLGVVRLVEPGTISGHKLFAFGNTFPDRSYTDGDSQYFEIWGGVNAGFWPEDDVIVAPGETLAWQEKWWPLAGLAGLNWATEQVAYALNSKDDNTVDLAVLFARPQAGRITILAGDQEIVSETFEADPARPLTWEVGAPDAPIEIQIFDEAGVELLSHCPRCE